ncbi:MAG: hypothetical protein RR011_06455, partial [Oscillospiraceae bacterium]
MNRKQFLHLASFAVLALGLIFAMGQLFRDKDTTLASFYSEPKNTIDVITVGSSHVNSGVIPAVFWQDYGINAHNVYSWSQPIWISYHYIKEALRLQSPKVVVVDLYGMMYGNSSEQPVEIDKVNYRNSFSIDPSLNFLEMTQTVADCGIDLKNPIDFLNPIRFHTAWKNLSAKNFTENPHKRHDFLKGYGVQAGVCGAKKADTSVEDLPREPYDTAVRYLDKIVKLSQKENFQLVFLMLPYEFMPEERELFAWLKSYAQQKEIPFLNYCEEDGDRIGFDYAEDFADPGHANYGGAYKLTADIASFVSSKYLQTPTVPKNAQQLDIDAQQMYRVLEVNKALTENTADYFSYLSKDENSVVIASVTAQGDASVSKELLQGLESIGVAPQKSLITVVENG